MARLLFTLISLLLISKVEGQDLLIKNINVIPMTSDTVLINQSVLIQNGKILDLGESLNYRISSNTKILDGSGKYLMPGLSDMHVHLPEENKIEYLLYSSVAAGITHIRVMNSKVSQIALREKLSKKQNLISPNIHFSHLIQKSDSFSQAEADSLMVGIKTNKISFIKLLGLSNEETFDNLTFAANKHNVTICGHYPVYQYEGRFAMVEMEKVIKSKFKSIEHLAGYIWLQDKDQIDNILKLTKEYNIYNCPTLDWDIMSGDLMYPEQYKNRLTYLFLPKSVTKDWESNYQANIIKAGGKEVVIESREKKLPDFELKEKILKRLYENNCRLLIGGDAGNDFQADGFNIYEEMINWRKVGIDNYTILKSATVTPSQFFDEEHLWGTIEVDKKAEMIILTKNPLENIENIKTIETTIVGGEIYNNKTLMENL